MFNPAPNAAILVITARSELRKVLFLALSVTLFVYEISREPLNGFAPNSQGIRVWSLVRMSLNVKVKGPKSMTSGTKNGIFGPYGGLRAIYVW